MNATSQLIGKKFKLKMSTRFKKNKNQNQDFGLEILRVLTVKFDLNKYSNVYPFKSHTALASLNFDLFPVEFFAVEPGDFAVYRFWAFAIGSLGIRQISSIPPTDKKDFSDV